MHAQQLQSNCFERGDHAGQALVGGIAGGADFAGEVGALLADIGG